MKMIYWLTYIIRLIILLALFISTIICKYTDKCINITYFDIILLSVAIGLLGSLIMSLLCTFYHIKRIYDNEVVKFMFIIFLFTTQLIPTGIITICIFVVHNEKYKIILSSITIGIIVNLLISFVEILINLIITIKKLRSNMILISNINLNKV